MGPVINLGTGVVAKKNAFIASPAAVADFMGETSRFRGLQQAQDEQPYNQYQHFQHRQEHQEGLGPSTPSTVKEGSGPMSTYPKWRTESLAQCRTYF